MTDEQRTEHGVNDLVDVARGMTIEAAEELFADIAIRASNRYRQRLRELDSHPTSS